MTSSQKWGLVFLGLGIVLAAMPLLPFSRWQVGVGAPAQADPSTALPDAVAQTSPPEESPLANSTSSTGTDAAATAAGPESATSTPAEGGATVPQGNASGGAVESNAGAAIANPVPGAVSNSAESPFSTGLSPGSPLLAVDPSIEVMEEGFRYDPSGKRDPFQSYIKATPAPDARPAVGQAPAGEEAGRPRRDQLFPDTGQGARAESLTNFDLNQLRLVGVLWDVNDPKAMVRTPSGKVYLLRRLTRIGINNGYVAAIREGEVVVIEMSGDGRTHNSRIIGIQ